MRFSEKNDNAYHLLSSSESNSQDRRVHHSTSRSIIKICFFVVSYLIVALIGYLASANSSYHNALPRTNGPLELELLTTTFHYDRNFSYPPSNHTNKAWRALFPDQGGFFVNPNMAPTRSTFSVFHQLHCLNGLRGAYFANHHAASEGRQLVDQDLPVDLQTSHMRHCIDYLRQNIMCQADTTLEVVDESINGVHGFRTAHVCRNWAQLRDWTSEQQKRQRVEQIE